jgi:hypothetical protein
MKYYLLLEGHGYGCDYTIGCNLKWEIIEAESDALAAARAKEIIVDYSPDRIKTATLVKIESPPIDLRPFLDERVNNKKQQEEAAAKEKRRKEFEKLQQEFGK